MRKLKRMAIGNVSETTNAPPRCPITSEDGDRADDELLADRAAHRLDGAVDERRAVVEGDDPHAFGQPDLESRRSSP